MSAYGKWRAQLCIRTRDHDLSPKDVAAELLRHAPAYPEHEDALRAEADELRHFDHWLDLPMTAGTNLSATLGQDE